MIGGHRVFVDGLLQRICFTVGLGSFNTSLSPMFYLSFSI